jgi:Homeodomain-like domain
MRSEVTDTVTPAAQNHDEVLVALDDLAGIVEDNARDERLLARRINRLQKGRAQGHSWHALLASESRPGTLELAARVLRRLTETSGRLRRALVKGLRAEGATIPAIAKTFGVSHQRVSSLLRRQTGI